MENEPQCALCGVPIQQRICRNERNNDFPQFCPLISYTNVVEASINDYQKPEYKKISDLNMVSSSQRYLNFKSLYHHKIEIRKKIEEIGWYATEMKFKKIGLVFCVDMRNDSFQASNILTSYGFSVLSLICDCGISYHEENNRNNSMSNPLFHSRLLNYLCTDINILINICVGHESLFLKKSNAYCTFIK